MISAYVDKYIHLRLNVSRKRVQACANDEAKCCLLGKMPSLLDVGFGFGIAQFERD